MNIKDLKPGRDLDYLIAEKVMGLIPVSALEQWRIIQKQEGDSFSVKYFLTCFIEKMTFNISRPSRNICFPPQYSTEISAAWLIVEKLCRLGYKLDLDATLFNRWMAEFDNPEADLHYASSDTAPHAICLAALKVSEDEKKRNNL